MKYLLLCIAILSVACSGKQQDYRKAEDALDAGREFINSKLQGDFSKAAFYTLPNEKNTGILQEMERSYRKKNREGRQQWRTASINIKEVKDLNDSITVIYFQNSSDKLADTIYVVKQKGDWLVDISKKE
ncbi:MAG: hypothetical protein AAB212_05170 [Bacteroidota bacterium]